MVARLKRKKSPFGKGGVRGIEFIVLPSPSPSPRHKNWRGEESEISEGRKRDW
jgi:hypothetical protein